MNTQCSYAHPFAVWEHLPTGQVLRQVSAPDIPADVREAIEKAVLVPANMAYDHPGSRFDRICAALAPFFAAKDEEIADLKRQLAEANAILDWVDSHDCWIGLHWEYDLSARFYVGGSYEMKVRSAYESAMQQEGRR